MVDDYRSKAFYDQVFGWPAATDTSGSVDEPGVAEAGIVHGDVIELPDAGLAILSFQDPDDINIELTAPLG